MPPKAKTPTGKKPGQGVFAPPKNWIENPNDWKYLLNTAELNKHWQLLGVAMDDTYKRQSDILETLIPNFEGMPPGTDWEQFHLLVNIKQYPHLVDAQNAMVTELKRRVAACQPNTKKESETKVEQPKNRLTPEQIAEQDFAEFKKAVADRLCELIQTDDPGWPRRKALLKAACGNDDSKALYEMNGDANHWIALINQHGQSIPNQSERKAHAGMTEQEIRDAYTIDMKYGNKHSPYLLAAGAVLLFWKKHPDGCIQTEMIGFEFEKFAVFKAHIYIGEKSISTGHALITVEQSKQAKGRYVQMAETHAVRRALAFAALGTEELIPDDDGDSAISDAPTYSDSKQETSK